jgi:hypothetical protein
MKTFVRPAFILLCLAAVTMGSAMAQITSTGIELAPQYDTFIPPTVTGSYNDPVFGSNIQRVSNALAMPNNAGSGYLPWIENEYSTMSAFNNNNSRFILVHSSYFGLYNGVTGAYMNDLPFEINASSEPRWSRKDLVTLYYHSGNQIKSYNTSTGGINVVHTFTEYSSISGNGEMDISLDGDHLVYVGDTYNIFVYQISTDRKYAVLNTNSVAFDSVYITPKNEVIVSWYPTGTARFTGQELFDINMNFLRQVGHADGHKHLTVDTKGQEVLIWTNSNDPQPIANCNNGIVKINLSNASQTCLAQLDWSLAVHISAADGNGYVFVDTEAPANPESGSSGWKPYTNEIIQIKLDGSSIIRLAHHRSRANGNYNWEPKLDVSRDGTRLLFASNYDLEVIDGDAASYADTYLLTVSSPSATTTAPPTPTTPPTPTVVLYNGPGAVYGGTWYPNIGSFNLGGSAVLAMDAGSEVMFTFTGIQVTWIGYRDQWSGIAQVFIDGVLQGSVDTYLNPSQAQTPTYTSPVLAQGTHTLTISVTGTQDSASAGSWVWVNAFSVTP